MTMNNLADVYAAEGKYAQAEALLSKNLEVKRRVLGPEHPGTLGALADAAAVYEQEGKYALAETHATQALAGRRPPPWLGTLRHNGGCGRSGTGLRLAAEVRGS
jgi:tetratricopeptide (TPR) repeat protein